MNVRRCIAFGALATAVAMTAACGSSSTTKSDPNRVIASASAQPDNQGINVLPTKVSPCLVNADIIKSLVQGDIDKPFTTTTQSTRLQGRQCNYGANPAVPEADIQVYTSTPGAHDAYQVLTAPQNNVGSHQVALTPPELTELRFNGATAAIWYFNSSLTPSDPTSLAMDVNGTMVIISAPVPAHASTHYRTDVLDAGTIAAYSLKVAQANAVLASR